MKKIKNYFFNEIVNKETLAYMFWGGLTAFMTVVLYFVFVNTVMSVALANTVANLLGIIAAYYTQKKYVFDTQGNSKEETRKELIKFFSGRILTYVFETILLVILVVHLSYDKNLAKIFTSFITVILNYFVAKIAVFS